MDVAPHHRSGSRRRWQSPGSLLLLAGSVLPLWGAAYSARQTAAAESTLLPAGKGAELTQKLCATCHTVESFNGLRRSASEWNDTVAVMVAYGAEMDEDQTRIVVQYLGEVFGLTSPPLLDANRAGREDLEKLPGLDAASIEMLLNHRERHGAFKRLQQVQEMLGADRFRRVKGYLVVRKPQGAELHRP